MTAQQAVAEVLAEHVLSYSSLTEQDICGACGALAPEFSTRYDGLGDRARAHQADILSAADLLATPEHDAQVATRAWGEGYGAGLSKGLDIAESAGTPVVSKILPPPRNPYRIERQEGER